MMPGNTPYIEPYKDVSKNTTPKITVPRSVREHRLEGEIVYATAYVNYVHNAEWCADDILGIAYNLMTNKYKNASSLVLTYGIEYSNKYGDELEEKIGTFKPNVKELRRYKYSSLYESGATTERTRVYFEFYNAGYK